MAPHYSSSSSSSSLSSLLLCFSIFVAVSSVGKALSFHDQIDYRERDDDYNQPMPSWEDNWGCTAVNRYISTCLDYLNGRQDTPSSECCQNVINLSAIAVEVSAKWVCHCTKDLRGSFLQPRASDEIYKICNFEDNDLRIPIAQGQCPWKTDGASMPRINA